MRSEATSKLNKDSKLNIPCHGGGGHKELGTGGKSRNREKGRTGVQDGPEGLARLANGFLML